MPQPSQITLAQKRQAQNNAQTGSQARVYYPLLDDESIPLPVRQALRQYGDHLNDIRTNYSPSTQYVRGSGDPVTVTTDPNGFGLSFPFNRQGVWILTAAVCLNLAGDASQNFTLSLYVGTIQQPYFALANQAADGTVMLHQSWQVNSITGEEVCTLKIQKAGGGGTSNVDPSNSTLTGTWQGTGQP